MLNAPACQLSPRRAELTSFAHAYVIAVRLREASGIDQYVVRTSNPLQPIRITSRRPVNATATLAMVA